jgi:deoxyribonuclease V
MEAIRRWALLRVTARLRLATSWRNRAARRASSARKTVSMPHEWPRTAAELEREQERLARAEPAPWSLTEGALVAGCFVCFPRGPTGRGAAGDPAWAAAATQQDAAVIRGAAGAPYAPGLLALREGRLLEVALRALPYPPDVVLVDATGRDHPRGGGLALHMGAVLDLPTVGVTHRPLLAQGAWPEGEERGASSTLLLGGEHVACWLRTWQGARPLVVHPGWRTDAATARAVVLASARTARTPEPLRSARTLARTLRADDELPGRRA